MTKSLIAILIVAALVGVASTAVLAHEDGEAGGYKLVVGFMDEPAYESERNAVSLRVTKEAGEGDEESSGMAGMAGMDMSSGQHKETSGDTVESEVPIDVSLMTEVEHDGGVNVQIMTDGWTWSTGGANHVPGEGHAHIYVDGELLRMVYEPVNHVSGLAPGDRHIRVTLSSNSHADLTFDGAPIDATAMVTVPDTGSPRRMSQDMDPDADAHSESGSVPVEGLQDTLKVEVTHVPSNVSRMMDLRAVFDDPGHYAADLIPTSPGHYRFRFFGAIEVEETDATFDSKAGGGDFDDVRVASAIHFPDAVASARELESAVRGLQADSDETREQYEDRNRAAVTMAIIGIVLGASGIAFGVVSLVLVIRSRKS